MSIVGCYSLDLYCENFDIYEREVEDKFGHRYDDFPDEFTGYDRAECFRNARKAGWVINVRKHTAYCPKCSHKKPKEE